MPIEEPWAGATHDVDSDHHVGAWDAGRVEGIERAEGVAGPIEESGTAEWVEQVGEETAAEEHIVEEHVVEEHVGEEQPVDAAVAELAVADEHAENREPELGDADHSLARKRRTPSEAAAASDDDDWFRDVDDETASSPLGTPTAALEPALFHGLGDLERLGPTPQHDPAPAPVDAGADGGPTTWPEPDSRATVAETLERVALRIRDGDVALPSDVPSASEEAALAAVLAALLHSRSR